MDKRSCDGKSLTSTFCCNMALSLAKSIFFFTAQHYTTQCCIRSQFISYVNSRHLCMWQEARCVERKKLRGGNNAHSHDHVGTYQELSLFLGSLMHYLQLPSVHPCTSGVAHSLLPCLNCIRQNLPWVFFFPCFWEIQKRLRFLTANCFAK